MLTLTTHGAPATPPRSLIPPCLQPRAPHSYELFDETGNRLQPTLSGYKLKPGHSYYLKVRAQDDGTAAWKMRLLAPRSQVDSNKDDYVEGDRRVIQFHVEARHFWEQFASRISMLPVHLEHADGRELYRFEIPVVLTLHWSMWAISLLGLICAPLSFLVGDSTLAMKSLLLIGALGGLFIILGVVDFVRSYRRGCEVLRACSREG